MHTGGRGAAYVWPATLHKLERIEPSYQSR